MSQTKKETENFMVKKEIFDKIAMQVICHSCKVVPRNSPIYQSETGNMRKHYTLIGQYFKTAQSM